MSQYAQSEQRAKPPKFQTVVQEKEQNTFLDIHLARKTS